MPLHTPLHTPLCTPLCAPLHMHIHMQTHRDSQSGGASHRTTGPNAQCRTPTPTAPFSALPTTTARSHTICVRVWEMPNEGGAASVLYTTYARVYTHVRQELKLPLPQTSSIYTVNGEEVWEVHACAHTCRNTGTHAHRRTGAQPCRYAGSNTHRTHAHARAHARAHTSTHVYKHACIRAHRYVFTSACICAQAYVHMIHEYMHMHAYALLGRTDGQSDSRTDRRMDV